MADPITISLGCMLYDHTEALLGGGVDVAGVELRAEPSHDVADLFRRVVERRGPDVAELGFTFLLRSMDLDDPPLVGIPVFMMRKFQHSVIYVNEASGITAPADLAGATIGEFAVYGHDMGIWPKGILADEHGFAPERSRWLIGGTDEPMAPMDFVPQRHPDSVDVRHIGGGAALGPMLEEGRIDALISAVPPAAVLRGDRGVRRLFADADEREADYHRRTGIFPIMHVVVVRRDLLDANPGLATALYRAFGESKAVAEQAYRAGRTAEPSAPWHFAQLLDRRGVLVDDGRHEHGIAANRAAIDTFLRYHHEQGLSDRRLRCEDVFAAELLDT
ncbi:4,5-dihydroxyphthalate decarboxylase [Umezawaea sp. Da 62-37]|uniref:4,5-dihydroxyphthalate decarboxylase n=1 Tax=Umezawaea sp. Da 62-37 TaxID=3075927 RepID=UPI0028F6FBC4|nr:4,5-dihydroxyphthalate decarboxylase [Umezawaea sp. Da 62-37]WNV87187.1 4,5-dihydroxyphthalate decarboxylase [Umezawaea sp. Da 62-37]